MTKPLAILLCILGLSLLAYLAVNASPDARFGIVTIGGAIVAGIIKHSHTKQREILAHQHAQEREVAARHFESQQDGYQKFLNLLFRMFASGQDQSKVRPKEIVEAIRSIKKMALFSSGPEMIQAWDEFEIRLQEYTRPPITDAAALNLNLALDDLLRAIRKDLGHDDRVLERGEIVKSLILKKGEDLPDP